MSFEQDLAEALPAAMEEVKEMVPWAPSHQHIKVPFWNYERLAAALAAHPALAKYAAMEEVSRMPAKPHGHHGETLAAIQRRDAEVDTDVLWRGWETGHPVIARLVKDRRLLLELLGRDGR